MPHKALRNMTANEREYIIELIKIASQSPLNLLNYFKFAAGKDLNVNDTGVAYDKSLYEIACEQSTIAALTILIQNSNIDIYTPIRGKSPLFLVMQRANFSFVVVEAIIEKHIEHMVKIPQDAINFITVKMQDSLDKSAARYNRLAKAAHIFNETIDSNENWDLGSEASSDSASVTTEISELFVTLDTEIDRHHKRNQEQPATASSSANKRQRICSEQSSSAALRFRADSINSLDVLVYDTLRSTASTPDTARSCTPKITR